MFDINPQDEHKYDIICFFLCLHDMTWPTEALKIAKKMLKQDGMVLVAESPGFVLISKFLIFPRLI